MPMEINVCKHKKRLQMSEDKTMTNKQMKHKEQSTKHKKTKY